MNLHIGGCRGTSPVTQRAFLTYGGDTSAYLVEGTAGDRVLVDLGTGARALGARLQAAPGARRLAILMTHYHLDHTMGLPALGLLYDPAWRVTIAAPPLHGHRVGTVVPRLLHAPYWPLQVSDLAADIRFRSLPSDGWRRPLRIGRLTIRWCALQHPGGCTAYRIDEAQQAVVIATDVEWARSTPAQRAALARLCRTPRPASVLVMDGQYTADTYAGHEGWGHSTWQECVAFARATGVEKLRITHHAPDADDRALGRIARAVARACPQAALARAGDTILLT